MMFKLLPNHEELVVSTIVCWNPTYSGTEPISSHSEIVRSVWGGHWNCTGKKQCTVSIYIYYKLIYKKLLRYFIKGAMSQFYLKNFHNDSLGHL